ncbi:MAG: hypothetical protein J5963_06670, partial [Schwartzia sp.]|nr:hypothetical protein [Schwartzia sp. (in: firmicutes)]
LMSYKKSNKVQKILHNLKYNGPKEIGSFLGDYFGNQLIEEEKAHVHYHVGPDGWPEAGQMWNY